MELKIKFLIVVLLSTVNNINANTAYELPEMFQPLSFDLDYTDAKELFINADVQKVEYSSGFSIIVALKWEVFGDSVISIMHNTGHKINDGFIEISTTELRAECFEDDVRISGCRNYYGDELVSLYKKVRNIISKECGNEKLYKVKEKIRTSIWSCNNLTVSLILAPGDEEDDYWSVDLRATKIIELK